MGRRRNNRCCERIVFSKKFFFYTLILLQHEKFFTIELSFVASRHVTYESTLHIYVQGSIERTILINSSSEEPLVLTWSSIFSVTQRR